MPTNRRIFLKQIGIGAMGLGMSSSLPEFLYAATEPGGLPRSTPEKQGIPSAAISAMLDAIAKSNIEFHSIMVIRHGHVVAEGWWAPYSASQKHTMYSLSKSFTSTAVGFAVQEGKFTVETPVTSFFPDDLPKEISPNLAAMKVKHLLTMSTGQVNDTIPLMRNAKDTTWVKTFFNTPVEKEPGTYFLYNTGATYLLSAIVHKTTGQNVVDYLKPRLFDPLGIKDYDWETSPQGITAGGFGLRIKTEDIGKFSQLYIQKGKWKGKQLISEAWVEAASSAQIQSNPATVRRPKAEDDWQQGYGYQFWRCKVGGYRCDGAFGQLGLIIPEKDTVLVITEESFNTQLSMDCVWQNLLPAMVDSGLPENGAAQATLKKQLTSLGITPLSGNTSSPIATKISGKEFNLDNNDYNAKALSFHFNGNTCVFTLKDDKGTHAITCGINKWMEQKNGSTHALFLPAGRVDVTSRTSANATWADDKTLVISTQMTETAHGDRLTCIFDGDKLTVKFQYSISRGNPNTPDKRQDLQGRMA